MLKNLKFLFLVLAFSCTKVPSRISVETDQIQEGLAKDAFVRAESLYFQGKYVEAFPLFEDIVKKYPKSKVTDNVLLRMGDIEFKQKNVTGARSKFEKILELYPQGDVKAAALKRISDIDGQFPNLKPQHIEHTSIETIDLNDGLFVLGVFVPQSGDKKALGDKVVQAAELAKEHWVKQRAEFKGLKVVVVDSSGTPEEMQKNFLSLISSSGLIGVVGPMFLEEFNLVVQMAKEKNVPMISLASSEKISGLGDGVFRNSLTKSEQAEGLAFVAKELMKIDRFAILSPNNAYGSEFSNLFSAAYLKRGGLVVRQETYETNMNNLTESVKKIVKILPAEDRKREICTEKDSEKRKKMLLIKKAKQMCAPASKLPPMIDFEGLFIPDGFVRAKQILPTLAYYDISGVQVFGTNLWNTPEVFTSGADQVAQGALFLDGFFKLKQDEKVQTFVRAFYEKYASEPELIEAQAYDSAFVLYQTVVESKAQNHKEVISELNHIKDFNGVTGKMTFDSNGEIRHKLTPLVIDNQEIKILQ